MSDEMRTGTRTQCKRRYAPRGHRPVCKVKLGYEFCYLYAAIAPASGKFIALLLPDMTKDSFSLFVDHFQKTNKGAAWSPQRGVDRRPSRSTPKKDM